MKVLFVNHTSTISGAEHSLLVLLGGMPSDAVAGLACPPGPLADLSESRGIPVHRIRGTGGSLRLHPWRTPLAVAEIVSSCVTIARISRRTGSSVLHANSLRAGLIAGMASRVCRRACVTHVRDCLPESFATRLTHDQIARSADEVVAVSHYVARRFQSGLRVKAPSIRVVDEPFDFQRFRAGLGDAAATGRNNGPLLLIVGQISSWKGHDTAIRALADLRDRHPGARLQIVGDIKFSGAGTRLDNHGYLAELRGLIEKFGLGEAVDFTGERDDVPELMARADVLLAPSTEEPFGRTVVEAMAVETPVVATSIGGPAEVIDDGLTGLLVEPGDPGAWCKAIETILDRPDWAREMSRRGAEVVHRRFATERHVAAMIEVYESALERVPPSRRT